MVHDEEEETAAGCSHVVQFYEDEAFLADVIGGFLGAGLAAGDAAVVIATPARREALRHRFSTSNDALTLLDARETLGKFMDGDLPDAARFESIVGGLVESISHRGARKVRAFGEMVDVLWRDGNRRAAIRLEELWTALQQRFRFSLFCAYAFGHFYRETDREGLDQISAAHTHVLPTDRRVAAIESENKHRRELEGVLRAVLVERAQLLERERAARAEAQAANRAKDEFLAMLGHELRNPLSPIVTALELARMRGHESRELEVIDRQVKHLIGLVDDLLDISRIIRGGIELRRERLEICEIVGQAVEMASPHFEQRRQVISLQVPRTDCVVDGDRVRLAQVVSNLLVNAAKYSETGARIDVTAERSDGRVRLVVRDRGMGIEPEMLGRIFDIFVQQQQARDRARGGLGLGLAIVRSLVELHGGQVTARSDGPGRGSDFEVALPAADPSPAKGTEEAHRDRAARPIAPRHRVLLVDDNEDGAFTLAQGLTLLQHDVRVAHDGPSALRIAREFHPTVALLDIGLPVMDGYELARRLRAEPWAERLHLIALTGYGQAGDRTRSQEVGFTEHAVKPIDITAVDELLRRVC